MNRVKIHQLVNDQFPEFVQQSYPEFITFIEGYYKGLETPGAVLDVVNNIDHYALIVLQAPLGSLQSPTRPMYP